MLKNKIVALCMLMVILNVVLFSAVQAQKPPDNRHLEMIPEEQEDYYRFEHKRVSKESGTPLALYNVNYAVYPDTPEKMARQYLQDNARLLMINTDLSDLAHTSTRETPGGFHVRFQQHIEGYSVYQGDIVVNLDRNHTVTFVMNSYKPRARLDKPAAAISLAHGEQVAKQYLNVQGKMIFEKKETVVYYNRGVTRLAHKITMVPAEDVFGDWEVLVDAHSGEIFRVQDKALYGGSRSGSAATGAGRVFDPDPLTRAGALYQAGGQFGDNNDQDTDSLVAQIVDRDLLDIDFDGSQYHLKGPYAQIVDIEAPFNGLFSRSDSLWQFTRNPDDFEAANVYFHLDQSMRYINETLGFPLMPFQYTGGVKGDPHGLNGADNSHYISSTGSLAWGEGGVDDAEDPDVILHELGHGIHDWVTNGNLSQVTGLSEGSGDYWANSYNRSTGFWMPSDPQYYWVFQWDGHNEFWGGRITNYSATYPGGLVGQVHTDGQIWASTLMQIWDDIGRTVTDLNFLEALSMTNGASNQEDAAQAFIQADVNLHGGANLWSIDYWFTQRGYNISVPVPTIVHTPLSDNEDVTGPYPVTAVINAAFPLAEVMLIYGTEGVFSDTLDMVLNGNQYSAGIPGTGLPANYNYYIFAADSTGLANTNPPGAPGNYHTFTTGPDTLPPVIVHTPLKDQAYISWPASVRAEISDNLGIASAQVTYLVNDGTISGSFDLVNIAGNFYEGVFDIDTTIVATGDTVRYRIAAVDSSLQANSAFHPDSGYHTFEIIDVLGVVLVIDDDPLSDKTEFRSEKGASSRNPWLQPFSASANLMKNTLAEAGYAVTVEEPNNTDPTTWSSYDLIISSSGISENSLSNAGYRNALIAYSQNGGKFIVEGGEVGWNWRNDPNVMNHLLHSSSWNTDNAGALQLVGSQANHPIVTTPNQLPPSIAITYTGYGSEDAMTPSDAYVVYNPASNPGDAGVSVYDDNSNPISAQSVYYAFNFAQVTDSLIAKALLENTAAFLLKPEQSPNTAPSAFHLLTPADGDTVAAVDTVEFRWNASLDAENDPLVYTVVIFNSTTSITIEGISDTTYLFTGSGLEANTSYEWLVKVSDGEFTTVSADTFSFHTPLIVGLAEVSSGIPEKFALHQNYPNPFNPSTTIQYDLKADVTVKLMIYNILGQEVRTLVNGKQTAGYKQVKWDGRNNFSSPVASGIYIYKLEAGDFIQTRKMIFLK
jgi:hypothetical protein